MCTVKSLLQWCHIADNKLRRGVRVGFEIGVGVGEGRRSELRLTFALTALERCPETPLGAGKLKFRVPIKLANGSNTTLLPDSEKLKRRVLICGRSLCAGANWQRCSLNWELWGKFFSCLFDLFLSIIGSYKKLVANIERVVRKQSNIGQLFIPN